jgi:hypothetical protein
MLENAGFSGRVATRLRLEISDPKVWLHQRDFWPFREPAAKGHNAFIRHVDYFRVARHPTTIGGLALPNLR